MKKLALEQRSLSLVFSCHLQKFIPLRLSLPHRVFLVRETLLLIYRYYTPSVLIIPHSFKLICIYLITGWRAVGAFRKQREKTMIKQIKTYIVKYQSIIKYTVFGLLTTLINMLVYHVCFNGMGIQNVPSTVIAWFLAVAFAFVTNKLWVFDSKLFDGKTLLHEISTFLGCRIATGLLDIAIMYVAVDLMHWNSTIWKLISNVLVIIINYIASRLVIFKKRES